MERNRLYTNARTVNATVSSATHFAHFRVTEMGEMALFLKNCTRCNGESNLPTVCKATIHDRSGYATKQTTSIQKKYWKKWMAHIIFILNQKKRTDRSMSKLTGFCQDPPPAQHAPGKKRKKKHLTMGAHS